MEYGYVCFAYTKNKWYDWAIAKATKSKWSHSFITCPPMLGKEMVLEAADGGVEATGFDLSYRTNPDVAYEVYRLKVSQDFKDASILNRMKELEVSYGFLEYPWFIWRYINAFFGRDIKSHNNWCQNGTEVCSQFLREYIEDCNLSSLFSGFGKGSVAPQDIYNVVLARPDLFELVESKT